jgi:hypothetical protein
VLLIAVLAVAAYSCKETCHSAGGRCVLGGFTRCVRTGAQDCNPDLNPGGAFCCLEEKPAATPASTSNTCDDGGVRTIQASDYDQSCTTDSDCVPIGEGNACLPCTIACKTAVIGKAAEARYRADLGALLEASQRITCHCPFSSPSCCREGKCHADQTCSTTTP